MAWSSTADGLTHKLRTEQTLWLTTRLDIAAVSSADSFWIFTSGMLCCPRPSALEEHGGVELQTMFWLTLQALTVMLPAGTCFAAVPLCSPIHRVA